MKRKILHLSYFIAIALFGVVIPDHLLAQNYLPLPDSNATWIIVDDSSQGTFYGEYVLNPFLDDTLINNIEYHKIFSKDGNNQLYYAGAFRSSSDGKTYYVPSFWNSTQEYLWYDLTKNVGDTVNDVALNYLESFEGTFNLIVDSIKFKNAGPYNLKCLFLSAIPPVPTGYNGNPIVWVEHIGSLNGGIFNVYACGLNMTSLKCMSNNDTTYYSPINPVSCFFWEEIDFTFQQGTCDLYVGINDLNQENQKICIFPNPADNYLFIENLPSGNIDVCIYNAFGQMVFNKRYNSFDNNNITLQHEFMQGVFFIKLLLNNNELWQQKIIIK